MPIPRPRASVGRVLPRSRHDSGGSPLPRTASWLEGPRETRSGSRHAEMLDLHRRLRRADMRVFHNAHLRLLATRCSFSPSVPPPRVHAGRRTTPCAMRLVDSAADDLQRCSRSNLLGLLPALLVASPHSTPAPANTIATASTAAATDSSTVPCATSPSPKVHPPARAYSGRKQTEGKSRREAIRCLKRQLARTIYSILNNEPQLTEEQHWRRRGSCCHGAPR